MRNRIVLVMFLFCCTAVIAAEPLLPKWEKRVDAIDVSFETAKVKAEGARANALAKAHKDRIASLRKLLSDATKSGDFDGATAMKARVVAAEKDANVFEKPEHLEKFGSHQYAFLQDNSTWYSAKRKCEQMGGHLITIETPLELAFLNRLCEQKHIVWLGANDHEKDDAYVWLNGSRFEMSENAILDRSTDGAEDVLCYDSRIEKIVDWYSGGHLFFVCEWD